MKLGDYQDGRELTYDEATQAFAVGEASVTIAQVLEYDAAGQIGWVSDDMRAWAQSLKPTPPPPPQANAVPTTPSPSGRPWFKKWWVWVVAAVLVIGIAAAGSGGTATDQDDTSSTAEATTSEGADEPESVSASEPELEPLKLDVDAPPETEADTAELKGMTLPGASVTVSGQSVEVGADGAFVYSATLASGDNAFEVAATLDGYEDAKRTVNVSRRSYSEITARDFQLVVKDPDSHVGETYIIWGEVTQFDAATGLDSFRANTGGVKSAIEYGWMTDYDTNSFLSGDKELLADVVEGDCFGAKVEVVGSYSYDTQAGGNTTAPLFKVYAIDVYGTTEE